MTSPSFNRAGRWLFLLSLGTYVATAGGSLTTTDAVVAFDLTRRMVDERSVALSGNLLGMDAHRGADGRYYSPFGVAQSIYNIPFYVAGRAMAAAAPIGNVKSDSLAKAAVAMGQTLVVAALIWLIFRTAALVASPRTALVAALTCAFGSVLWPYSGFGFNQPLAALALLASIYTAVSGVRESKPGAIAMSGAWLAVGLLTRHELALAVAPIAAWIALDGRTTTATRLRRLLMFFPGVLAGLVAWLGYNALRFGNPLDSGFLRDPVPGFGSPILDGLAGLTLSPAASVFLYSPFAIFGAAGLVILIRRDRSIGWLLSVLAVGSLLFYATLANWVGGRSYGSRYLIIVLPILGVGWAAVIDSLRSRARHVIVTSVIGLGVLLQLPGVLVDYAKVSQAVAARDGAATTEARQWTWAMAPLVLNTRALATALPENVAYLAGTRTPPPIVPASGDEDRSFSRQFVFSLDLWWLYLFYLGALSRTAVVAVVFALAAGVAVCGYGLSRESARLSG